MPRARRFPRGRSWTVAVGDSGGSARAGSRWRLAAEEAVRPWPAPARAERRVRAPAPFVPSGDRPGERDRLARLEPHEELARQIGVRLGRGRVRVVDADGLAVAWRLRQAHSTGNPRARDELWKV